MRKYYFKLHYLNRNIPLGVILFIILYASTLLLLAPMLRSLAKVKPQCEYDYKIEIMFRSNTTDTINKKITAPCNDTEFIITGNNGVLKLMHTPTNRTYGPLGITNVEAYKILSLDKNK
jgi:hypothetical protein